MEDVPETEFPAGLADAAGSNPAPSGVSIDARSEGGEIEVVLGDSAGTRTIFAGKGSPDYMLQFAPIWSPDGRWLLIGDGRLIVLTVGDEPRPRILVENPGGIGYYTSAGIAVAAATDIDLMVEGG